MTRSTLRRTLRWSYVVLFVVLAISLVTKLAEHIPGISGTPWEKLAKDVYEYLKDMALVLVTVVATFLAGVYQRRQGFISALKEEWRDIIKAKSALFSYTQLENPTKADYLTAFCAISETLDNMRSVYSNVGETDRLIGLYPFAPLHDMRRALQSLDPAKTASPTPEERKLARDAILQAFYALGDSFLEELDLEAPDRPLLAMGGRRIKTSGATSRALASQDLERQRTDTLTPVDPRIQALLQAQREREQSIEKPWRPLGNGAGRADDALDRQGPLS